MKPTKRNQWKMLSLMISIVSQEFANVLDKGGQPYILHCFRVMNTVNQLDAELMQIAIGHDLIEDTDWTLQGLRDVGFSERVINGIDLVTFKDGDDYMERIKLIALNKDAKAVKMADLEDNSRIFRLKGLRKKDFDRLQKYFTAYAYLKD